ncbi:hypothetical protein ISS37_04820 [candidate division KSB1 bacterium]|nr:hypothetical protein [candidate division KSB1 bacterium]
MARRGNLNRFQVGRAGREKRLRPLFCNEVNKFLKDFHFEVFEKVGPDYMVLRGQETVVFFEAEFPTEGRWPLGGEFRYDTIRWPLRKWEHYCEKTQQPGFYDGKPLFLISIRGDLKDAYYIDALTWCQKSNIEYVRNSVFRGFPKTYPEMGRGIEKIEKYFLDRLKKVYEL